MQTRYGVGGAALGKSYAVLPYSTRDLAIPAPLPRLAQYELLSWMVEGAGDICLSVAPSHAQALQLEVDMGT